MKFFENASHYDYSFPAVTLAFFLRYPNPYSRHVLTSDVVDRYVDPDTKRLHTTRLHLKRSKVPGPMLKLLPKGIGGTENAGQSYILEKSVVDVQEGWMHTESRNMEWTGILSVVEQQNYQRECIPADESAQPKQNLTTLDTDNQSEERTTVQTKVTFRSRLGQGMLTRYKKSDNNTPEADYPPPPGEEDLPRKGFLASWSTAGIQRTVELIGLRRTQNAVFRSKQGMNVVLERLRHGGVVAVLEGMRQDRETTMGSHDSHWKRVWARGTADDDDDG